MRRPFVLVPVLACLFGFSLPGLPTVLAADPCTPEIKDSLAGLGLAQSEIKSVSVKPQIRSTREGGSRVTGYDVWVRLQSCRGALIIEFSRQCRQRQAYTRDECRVTGLSAY